MDNLNKNVIDGFAWEASTRFVVQIASWVSTIWVARLLTPDDYGLVGISGIFTGLCLMFAGMGLSNALINKDDISEDDMANIFWSGALLAALIYSLLYFTAPAIAAYYEIDELSLLIRVAGALIIISPLSIVPRALMARQLKFKRIALISFAGSLLVTVLTLSMAFAGFGYWSLVISTLAAELLTLVIYFLYAKYIPSRPKNISSVFSLYKYGLNILGARFFAYLNNTWPVIFSGQFFGKAETGYYQFANTIAVMPMSKIGQVFAAIAFPVFSRIKNDKPKLKRYFLLMHKYLFIVVAPMFVGIALTATEFVPILLGEKWANIVIPIQILCMANVFAGSALLVPSVFEGLGAANMSFRYELLMVMVLPIALAAGVSGGLNVMLLGLLVAIPVGYGFLLYNLFRMLELSALEFLNSISVTAMCVILMTICIFVTDYAVDTGGLFLLLSIKITVGAIVYSGSYFLLGKKDLIEFIRLLRYRRVEVK